VRRSHKWFWILTILNVLILVLAVLVIWATLSLIGIAAEIPGWPLLTLLSVGEIFSLAGVLVARRVESRKLRSFGLIANAPTLAFHSIIWVGLAILFIRVPRERFLIPDGYMGDIYVIHGVAEGKPEVRSSREVTYRIPQDGILLTQAPMNRGFARSLYYYERSDGALKRIWNEWNTTIQRTPENIANKKDVGIFFPRTGSGQYGSESCSIEYDEFSIGTPAYLLSRSRAKDLTPYLKEHLARCGSLTK
jgi:hypothetical protein